MRTSIVLSILANGAAALRRAGTLRYRRRALFCVAISVASWNGANAQTPASVSYRSMPAARVRLDSLASDADRRAADPSLNGADRDQLRASAAAMHQRLRDGDFHAGDRVAIAVRGEPTMTDTITLGDSLLLKLPGVAAIPLRGVLRAEAQERVATAIAAYVRTPDVRVTTLVRVGLLGQVTRPGYYQLSTDVPLSDALMAAGGPTPAASPDRTVVRRNTRVLFDERAARNALVSGATLGQLDLHSGDEIVVAERSQRSWATAAQILGAVSGILVSAVYIARR